jgi:hypothetical protein
MAMPPEMNKTISAKKMLVKEEQSKHSPKTIPIADRLPGMCGGDSW